MNRRAILVWLLAAAFIVPARALAEHAHPVRERLDEQQPSGGRILGDGIEQALQRGLDRLLPRRRPDRLLHAADQSFGGELVRGCEALLLAVELLVDGCMRDPGLRR